MTTHIPSISSFSDERLRLPRLPLGSPNQLVAFWLKRDIIRGVFEPNERLKIDFLAHFYGIGHSPVREAILYLSAGGLVVHEHQKGHRVAPVSLPDYLDTLDVYDRIRRLALGAAIERGDEDWEEQVIVQLHRSRKVPHELPNGDSEKRERWQRAYGDFYDTLIAGCLSPLLIDFYGDLVARAERYVNLFADASSDHERNHAAEHVAVVDSMLVRDADLLNSLLDQYDRRSAEMRDSIISCLQALELVENCDHHTVT